MTKTKTQAKALAPEPLLLNRELSWLDYDARVFELAEDEGVPLLERVKFCSIFSSMLDEFFMVRVAGLMDQAESGVSVRSADGLTPREALAAIRPRVEELVANQSRIWRKRICPALAAEGILVSSVEDCDEDELRQARLQRHERLGRGEPVRRPHCEARGLLPEQARHAHHEELVEVGREDRAELDPLEQRLRLVGGEVEHARVELDPRELAVEKSRVLGGGTARHRR